MPYNTSSLEPEQDVRMATCRGMFEMAKVLKVSDDAFDAYLETQRRTLGALDPAWLQD